MWLSLVAAVLAGGVMAFQGRVNANLAAQSQDRVGAAVVSFGSGLIVMVLITVLTPAGRRTIRRVVPALRRGEIRWWWLCAGFIGALLVISQTITVPIVGLALFTVALVTGQLIGGILVDLFGVGPAGRRNPTPIRVIGALVTLAAVTWSVTPALRTADSPWALLLPLLFPLAAGLTNPFQQALNGRQTVAYRSAIPSTLINFIAGTFLLVVVWLIYHAITGPATGTWPPLLSGHWWWYLGGTAGCVFIAVSALVIRYLGALLTGMSMIAGQLVGAVVLDLVMPSGGGVTAYTLSGTALALLAVVVMAIPPELFVRRSRRRP